MTLRRCDSLPVRLRAAPVPSEPSTGPQHKKIPDSKTVPDFNGNPDRDQIIATWKSLHTDVKKIKNGFPTKNEPTSRGADRKESITHNFMPAFACNKSNVRRKITYNNRQVGVRLQEADRDSPFPVDTGQANMVECGANMARRRTLLQRLLPWKTEECDCQERYMRKYRPAPKLRAEDLLCTCGVSAKSVEPPDKRKPYAERGRSKSVGYEAAREVTQFRRLVQWLSRISSAFRTYLSVFYKYQQTSPSELRVFKVCGVLGALALALRLVRRRLQHCALARLSHLPADTTLKVAGVGLSPSSEPSSK